MAAAPVVDEKVVNLIRLQLLVSKIGTESLREYFDNSAVFGPAILQGTLASRRIFIQTLKNRGFVNASQWDLLYPPGGAVPTSNQFDLTLLVLLLRNYGTLGEPRHFQWEQLPLPTDVAIYHDIARLKHYRNKYAHATSDVTNADFLLDWKDIEGAILRIVPVAKKTQFTNDIKELLTIPLHQDDVLQLQNAMDQQTDTLKTHIDDVSATLQTYMDTLSNQQAQQLSTSIQQVLEATEERTQVLLDHSVTKDNEAKSEGNSRSLSHETLDAFARKIKKAYKEKFKKVQSVSSDGMPTMFDVTSKMYMDLECTPLEMRCTSVDDRKKNQKPSRNRQKEHRKDIHFYKRLKGQNTTAPDSFNCDIIEGELDGYTAPMPATSYAEKERIDQLDLQQSTSHDHQEMETSQNETFHIHTPDPPKKATTTAQITRLFTTEENPDMLPILVEAEAGVGKTTLFHRLALNWANGCKDMEQFKLVILIPLRRVKGKTIEDIICDDLQLLLPDHKRDLKRCLDLWEDQILYLIDGLDEVILDPENDLIKLMQGAGTHVLCSSRPILQDGDMKQNHHGMDRYILINLLGFSTETLKNFINQYFRESEGSDGDMADKVIEACSRHFYCKSLMKIPLYAGLLCFLWLISREIFPETATQLFNRFLIEVLNNFLDRHSNSLVSCNNNLHNMTSTRRVQFLKSPMEKSVPHQMRRILKSVSKLAYTTLMEHKVVFTVEDADESDLSLADLTHIGLFTIEDDGSLIYFRHKLFHEYFAGLYLTQNTSDICKLFTDSREEILNKCHILQNAFFFAAGLCEITYEIIIFALAYSNHQAKSSSIKECLFRGVRDEDEKLCKKCEEVGYSEMSMIRLSSSFLGNHKQCCERCNETTRGLQHDFDVEKISECDDCYTMAIAMMYPDSMNCENIPVKELNLHGIAFLVQLIFEHHSTPDNKSHVGRLKGLPVHCASVHSLAAVIYAMQVKPMKTVETDAPKSIVLIDGPVVDIDPLNCILNECNNNENIRCITLMKAGQTLIEEMLNRKWTKVKRLGFVGCDVIVPFKKVLYAFPSIELVLYDKDTFLSSRVVTHESEETAPLDDVTIIVKDYEGGDVESGILHSLESCTKLTPNYTTIAPNRVVTLYVEDYEKCSIKDREKCVPQEIVKGVCNCTKMEYECLQESALAVVMNQHGLQWKHLKTNIFIERIPDKSPKICSLTLESGVMTLHGDAPRVEDFGFFVEKGKIIFTLFHLHLCKGGAQLWNDLFKEKRTGIGEVVSRSCDIIVPVDVLAERFPDVQVIAYDCETLENERPFAETRNLETTDAKNTKLCLTFGVYDRLGQNHQLFEEMLGSEEFPHKICRLCPSCTNTKYRNINVALENPVGLALLSSPSYEWERLVNPGVTTRGLCLPSNAKSFPCCQHLEYLHTDNIDIVAGVYEQNPGLKEVLLDVTLNIQSGLPRIDETMKVLRKNGQIWKEPFFVFDCLCVFEIEEVTIWNTPCFKSFEMAPDKVQAWCDEDLHKLNEQENFVLYHHALHKAPKEKGEKGRKTTLSKEVTMSWISENNATEMKWIKHDELLDISVYRFKDQSICVKFIRQT